MSVANLVAVLAPLVLVVALGGLVIARAIRSRRDSDGSDAWPRIYRELTGKQRASVRRALQDGRTVDDPSLAFAVVAAARSRRRHGLGRAQRRHYAVVGVALLAMAALGGWRAVTEPPGRSMLAVVAVLLVDGLLFIALVPASARQARRVAEAERANQALLDGA
jgi:Flp pilus assembly protein TadB